MLMYTFLAVGSFVFMTGSALLALRWALRTGQLRDHDKGSLLIFDDEEPLGEVTDRFPGEKKTDAS